MLSVSISKLTQDLVGWLGVLRKLYEEVGFYLNPEGWVKFE